MAPSRAFAIPFRLALATSILMFALIVIGSVVRTTGSGLACPDWPLCNGQLIPPFQFNIMIEWLHRLVALLVSLLLLATVIAVFAKAEVRARLGGLAALSVLLLFTQILLGALTVWKLLSPSVVSAHLAVALALFTTLLTLTLAARVHAGEEPAPVPAAPERGDRGLGVLFGVAALMTFGQALLGGIVSTNHAGLACPDFPDCNGVLFPAMEGAVALHMLHRYGAYALLGVMLLAMIRSRTSSDLAVRSGGSLLFGMTLAQATFGVLNVLLGIPVWLSALHLGMATAILALSVTLTFIALTPALGAAPEPARPVREVGQPA